jgi:hypothetical protein
MIKMLSTKRSYFPSNKALLGKTGAGHPKNMPEKMAKLATNSTQNMNITSGRGLGLKYLIITPPPIIPIAIVTTLVDPFYGK